MDIKENKNYNENENLLEEIKKECKKELSSVICFFEYDPKNNQCIARKLNNKDISKFDEAINIIRRFGEDDDSEVKDTLIPYLKSINGENKTSSYYDKHDNKEFYFIHSVKIRARGPIRR